VSKKTLKTQLSKLLIPLGPKKVKNCENSHRSVFQKMLWIRCY